MTDERKTASIEFRATPSAKARWQEAAGGPRKLSAWLTQLADARVAELADAAASSTAAERREGSIPSPSIESGSTGECPRWMHHRSGVYCGTCKKVN